MTIYGVEESDTEVLPEIISGILLEIGEKLSAVSLKDCFRVGIKKSIIRLVKFILTSSDVVGQVLSKATL